MKKSIDKVIHKQFQENIKGLPAIDFFEEEVRFEPFLVWTEFKMSKPIFGPHPHAGVSVMTYMLPESKGSFINKDSLGDNSMIEPGGVHVTQAGSGMFHDEFPSVNGIECNGFQIWLNHRSLDRFVKSKSFHMASKEVPEYNENNLKVRVIQGSYHSATAPFELVTKTQLFDVTLGENHTVSFETYEMTFVYLINGEITVNGQKIKAKSLIKFDLQGNSISVQANSNNARFIVASSTPIREPIVYGGPFVMTTQEQMMQAKRRLQNGEMGYL